MISDVDVCNLALSHLSASEINTLSDNTANAKACKTVFDTTRDSVLADFPWQFATFITTPTLIADEYFTGWEYLYRQPLKCLAVRKLFIEEVPNPEPIDYRLCTAPDTLVPAIAVNYEDPFLEYTRQITDPKLWTTKFAESFSLRLAATICTRLTGKESLAKELLDKYTLSISESKRQDGSAKKVEKTRESTYEGVR